MNTTHNRKKSVIAAVGAAVAAAAVPAFLFAGAGTAQAYTWITSTPDPSGITVHIKSFGAGFRVAEAQASSGDCTYTAIPQTPGPIEVHDHPFHLDPGGTADLHFLAFPTGATWDIDIDCPNGIDSPTAHIVY